MLQQINLYRQKSQKKIILPFKQIVTLHIIFIIILLIISIYKIIDYYMTAVQLHELKNKQENLNKGLESAQQAIPTEEDKKRLEQTLANLQEAKEYRQKMYTTLTQLRYQDSVGLSDYLSAMAEPNMSDLWLTKFNISDNGASITLEGITVNSSSVPSYLQALGKTKVFKGKTFNKLQIISDDKTNQTKFIIGS